MDKKLNKLTPIVISQGEVTWNTREDEHKYSVNDDFHKEFIASAKAYAQTRAVED